MSFNLAYTDSLPYTVLASGQEAVGIITIGEFEETFYSALDTMSKKDYLLQWRQATERVIEGHDNSAVITSFADRGGEIVGMWWPLFVVEGGLVRIQNRLILRDSIDRRFSLHNCYDYVGKRTTMTDDGEPISEWTAKISEVITFAASIIKGTAPNSVRHDSCSCAGC